MEAYKLQLISYVKDISKPIFLWASNPNLEQDLNNNNIKRLNNLYLITDKFDKECDLDLSKAKNWKKRLAKLGFDCSIVKINYPEEP